MEMKRQFAEDMDSVPHQTFALVSLDTLEQNVNPQLALVKNQQIPLFVDPKENVFPQMFANVNLVHVELNAIYPNAD
jgi:hypothetical protein